MARISDIPQPYVPEPIIKPKPGRDDWIQRGFIAVIAIYLVVAVVLPLFAMLAKAFSTYTFDMSRYEVQISDKAGNFNGPVKTLQQLNDALDPKPVKHLSTSNTGRQGLTKLFPDFSFHSPVKYRFRGLDENAVYLVGSKRFTGPDWQELDSNTFGRVVIRRTRGVGLSNFTRYFSTPSLLQSIRHSLLIAALSTLICVPLAFWFAYTLTRSAMRFKGFFRMIAMLPILVPSLFPGIALIYLFGEQGFLSGLLMGQSIYGPIGIVIGSVFFTFPHAMIIIATALSISDTRLYEASVSLRASRWKTFWTVTIPGARYGLLSATFVVFNLVFTDFGLPKVIGGKFNMLAVDIYEQVIGLQNFEMGAVVSVVLLVPAVLGFAIDRQVQNKQVALLSARSVVFEPKPNRKFDRIFLAYSLLIAVFIVGIIAVCQFAAIIGPGPESLSLSLNNYVFDPLDGGGWGSYKNSLLLAFLTAIVGTVVVFTGGYMVEKTKGFAKGRTLFQALAMLPMAIPGMVLGLSYVFFFNNPDNPLNFIYGTMAILAVSTVTHFYSVSHLTAITALKQMGTEFESVSQSLKQPFYKLFWRVTVPVSMPMILNISTTLFVNAMTTVSAVVFLYSANTALASVAVLNMGDAGDIAPAAAMGMMIFYTNAAARIGLALAKRRLLTRSEP